MEQQVLDKLKNAKRHIEVAMSEVQNASIMELGFDLSKPLNILYKELRAAEWLLMIYLGDKSIADLKIISEHGIEVVTPQSIQAFLNLNKNFSI